VFASKNTLKKIFNTLEEADRQYVISESYILNNYDIRDFLNAETLNWMFSQK
jgi:hypothetical protein